MNQPLTTDAGPGARHPSSEHDYARDWADTKEVRARLRQRQNERRNPEPAPTPADALVLAVSNVSSDGYTFVHDYSLDGDENLHVGARVQIADGSGWRSPASVIRRDDADGYWFLKADRLPSDPPNWPGRTRPDPALAVLAEALTDAFTSAYGPRNPHWDIDAPAGENNPYLQLLTLNQRLAHPMTSPFTAAGGGPGLAFPTVNDVLDVIGPHLAGQLGRSDVAVTLLAKERLLGLLLEHADGDDGACECGYVFNDDVGYLEHAARTIRGERS